ncbi:MAG: SIR2 family NAD-dependent protein deacylase [Chitinophagales bacterium]
MQKQKIVVLTGAGISAESGIATFRGSGGLWEGHDIMEVASPKGWAKNPELVLNFYNLRRADAFKAEPNAAHKALAKLEEKYEVQIVTQNVDNLHERGGSTKVLHLHGEITKVRSTRYPELVYDIGDKEILMGDFCDKGAQLRPDIVWFGEAVPMIEQALMHAHDADMFMVIGTSMAVYPAASLIHYVAANAPKYLIDPFIPEGVDNIPNLTVIEEKATVGVTRLVEELLAS